MGLGAVLGGIGAAGQLFGVGRQGYGAANGEWDQGQNDENQIGAIGNTYGQFAGQSQSDYNAARQNGIGSYQGLRDQYLTNPYATDQGGAAYENQAIGSGFAAADNELANAQSQLAQRGLTGDSSALRGTIDAYALGRQALQAHAQQALANQRINEDRQNAQNLYSLDQGQMNTDYGRASNAYGAQMGALKDQAAFHQQRANAFANMTNQNNNAVDSGWKSLGGLDLSGLEKTGK